MKTAIKIIVLCLLISSNNALAQNEKVVVNGTFENLILEEVDVFSLVMMDKNFKRLYDSFGHPLDSSFEDRFTEALWVFTYKGFKLTYIQLSPRGPELLKVEVTSPKVKFKMGENDLFKMEKPNSILNGRSFITGKKVKADLDDYLKFDGKLQYIEFDYIDNKLNTITFKRDLQI